MGACWDTGLFVDTDWKIGIRKIQNQAEIEYGHQEGYSGAPNSCTYKYMGDYSTSTIEHVKQFMDKQAGRLPTGCGGVIKIGQSGYEIKKIVESKGDVALYNYYLVPQYLENSNAVAILVNNGMPFKLGNGTVEQLKHKLIDALKKRFEPEDYGIIVGIRSKYYIKYSVESTRVATTNKITNNNIVVTPLNKYGYFGWCRD